MGGAIVGTVTGATVGAIVGGLPRKTATEVSDLVQQPASVRNFTQELGEAVRANVPDSRVAESGEALTLVALELTDVKLVQYRSDELAIKMQAAAKYTWGSPKRRVSATCEYESATEQAHVSQWLPGGELNFDQAFTDAINGLASQIAAGMNPDLTAPQAERRGLFGGSKEPEDPEELQRLECFETLRNTR